MSSTADSNYFLNKKGRISEPLSNGGVPTMTNGTNAFKGILEPLKPFLPMWNKIFLLACVIAVSLDPLFNYIPMINEKEKCITTDKKLKVSALIMRSVTDFIYLIDIAYHVAKASKTSDRKKTWIVCIRRDGLKNALTVALKHLWFPIIVDFLAVLPIPQVVILVLFPRIRGSTSLDTRKYLNLILLSQYVPRVLRIYLSCKKLKWTQDQLTEIVWVKGVFNLFLYILASHVFGAFWYFFSLQREIACWHQACRNSNECAPSTYYCGNNSPRNVTFLSLSCPINPPNEDLFNFGIYLDVLQSGVLGSKDVPQKFLRCFWWGLKNLSSLGQNLETSKCIWENAFAVAISIIGLLLFLYLIGNLQTYMQLATTRSEEIRRKMKMKDLDIELWITKNNLPKEMKTSISQKVKERLQLGNDVHMDNLLHILPHDVKKNIKTSLASPIFKKVKMLKDMEKEVHEAIIEHLRPVVYPENSYINREGEPVGLMLFITWGVIWTFGSANNNIQRNSSTDIKLLEKGHSYGEDLLDWAIKFKSFESIPISRVSVKSHTRVEGLAIIAKDLKAVVDQNWWVFKKHLETTNSELDRLQPLAASAVQAAWRRKQNKKKKLLQASREEDKSRFTEHSDLQV